MHQHPAATQHAPTRLSSGANVLRFPAPRARDGRLTWRDRIALHEARDELAAAGYRYVAHREEDEDGAPYDLVQLFQGEARWSTWCLVRLGPRMTVWRSADGSDVGAFATVDDALAALLAAPAYGAGRRPARG